MTLFLHDTHRYGYPYHHGGNCCAPSQLADRPTLQPRPPRYLLLPRLQRGSWCPGGSRFFFTGFTPLSGTGTSSSCPRLKPRRYQQQLPNCQPLRLPHAACRCCPVRATSGRTTTEKPSSRKPGAPEGQANALLQKMSHANSKSFVPRNGLPC